MQKDNSDKTFLMMECGRIDLQNPVDKAYLFMGKTKAGKTTSMHYMLHHSLIGAQFEAYNPVIYKFVKGGANAQQAKIGYHQNRSETQIPNYFQFRHENQNFCFIDLPGFSDTYGCFRAVSNRYFIHKVFSQVKKIKFIIVISHIDMLGTAQGLQKTFSYFFESFNDIHTLLPDILPSINLLFTGVPKQIDDKGIIQKYSRLEQKFPSQYEKIYQTLKQSLIKNKQVFLFRQAELGKAADVENNLLERVSKSCKKWWERKTDNEGKVDISQIKITLADFKDKDQKRFMQELKLFSTFIGERFKQIIKQENGLSQVINQFLSDCEKDTVYGLSSKVNKFLSENEEKIRKKNEQYNALYLKYKNKRKETQDTQFAQIKEESSVSSCREISPRFEKIRALKQISEIIQEIMKIDKQRDIKIVTKFLQSTKEIMKILMSLTGNKPQFKAYAYTIYSSLEIMKEIYYLLFNTTHQLGYDRQGGVLPLQFQDIYLNFPTDFKRFFSNIFSNKINPYSVITNFILSINTSTSYSNMISYDLLINFVNQAKASMKKNNNQSNIKNEKEGELTEKLDKITFQLQSKKLEAQVYHEKQFSLGNLFEYGQNIHKKIKEYEADPLKLNHIWEDNLCENFKNKQLIAFQLKKQNMKVALQIYQSLHDAHEVLSYYSNEQQNMKYDPKNQQSKQKMLKFLIEYMKKAYKYCRVQLAIQKAQKAYSIAQILGDKAKIEKIGKFLFKICPISYDESSGSDNEGLESSKREYVEMMNNGFFNVQISQELNEAVKSISKRQSPERIDKRVKSPPNKKKISNQ